MYLLNMFKKTLYLLFLICFFYHANSNDKRNLIFHESPQVIKNVTLNDLKGNEIKIKDLQGDLIILNFWATWCAPCLKEIPELINLKAELKKHVNEIFISVDSSPQKVIPDFIKKYSYDELNIFIDQKFSIATKLNAKVVPTTIVLDSDKNELARVEGYINWLDSKIRKKLRDL